jgi:hypothetical protein
VQINISSEIGGSWFLVKTENNWEISSHTSNNVAASLTIDPDIAWQLFTKALKPFEITEHITISGDHKLASTALTMIAVMA